MYNYTTQLYKFLGKCFHIHITKKYYDLFRNVDRISSCPERVTNLPFKKIINTPSTRIGLDVNAVVAVGADAVAVAVDSMMTDTSDFGCYYNHYNHCIISIFIYYKNAYLSKSTKMDWMLGYFLPVRTSMYPSVSASC